MLTITVSSTLPMLVSGGGQRAVTSFLTRAVGDLIQFANVDVHDRCVRSFVDPTPYYWTQITRTRMTSTSERLHDRGVSYGPWLEGTSSRNTRSRFKGYRMWELSRARMEAEAHDIVAPAADQLVRDLGGAP
jgi:hypothetical protein